MPKETISTIEITVKRIWWRWVLFKLYMLLLNLGLGNKETAVVLSLKCFNVCHGDVVIGKCYDKHKKL